MSHHSRRSVLKGIGVGTAAVVGGTGVVSAGPPSEGDTIVDVAIELNSSGQYEGTFDTLIAAVTEAGLVDTLSGNRQLTVFAPTDEAFEAAGITPDNVDEVDDEFLLNVLTYHVAPGRRDAESVTTSDKIPTLNGALIEVDGTRLNPSGPEEEQANIFVTDVEASNGIIHAIDGVLLP